jgi:hypothetical protein
MCCTAAVSQKQESHEELMGLEGHYAELFRLQAAAYLAGSPDIL